MKSSLLLFLLPSLTMADYYATIDPASANLKENLQTIISNRTSVSYKRAFDAFAVIDKHLPGYPCDPNDLSRIPDIYSSSCWTPLVKAEGGECGTYKVEGDCFNREHSWPKSWWGGYSKGGGAQNDLFELYPSDGYVNGLRGNLPFGAVSSPRYTSTNGCKIGACVGDTGDYTGECFEAADVLKGDLARTYFYLSTLYAGVWECCDDVATNEASIDAWEEQLLRDWHVADPVDDVEMKRNEVIFEQYQHNRNPFIDHPEYVDLIKDF